MVAAGSRFIMSNSVYQQCATIIILVRERICLYKICMKINYISLNVQTNKYLINLNTMHIIKKTYMRSDGVIYYIQSFPNVPSRTKPLKK